MKRIVVLLFSLCLPLPAAAEEPGPPMPLVEAIARHESGLNPLAVNVAGKSYYPATRQEAEAVIQAAQAVGRSFDVGLMQVNNWWMERYGIPPASLLDPAVNRALGEWILAQEIARHGFNWRAVGRYHSPDEERGRRYAWRVYWQYAGTNAKKTTVKPQGNSHADKTPDPQIVPQSGGIQRNPGVRPQGRIIDFNLR